MSDYFSTQSKVYSQSRPRYPDDLFNYIIQLCKERKLAWDCATGNGQTAVSLAEHFEKVFATDLSQNQITNAFQKPNITYSIEKAEACSLDDNSVDLVTVSTAVHWFDIPAFYKEVNRVLKKDGILAIWSYGGSKASEEINSIVDPFAFEFLRSYWPEETKMNWLDKYEHLSFPYPLLKAPKFNAIAHYSYYEFENYLMSWSATQLYMKKNESNPVDTIRERLLNAWKDGNSKKEIKWELYFKCGRKP